VRRKRKECQFVRDGNANNLVGWMSMWQRTPKASVFNAPFLTAEVVNEMKRHAFSAAMLLLLAASLMFAQNPSCPRPDCPNQGECQGQGQGQGQGNCPRKGNGPGRDAVADAEGAAGKLLVIKLGPERILLEADLELKSGDAISVKYAVTSHDDEMIAPAITKGSVTVTLRGDDCRPIWN
jgi:hypothetical protein